MRTRYLPACGDESRRARRCRHDRSSTPHTDTQRRRSHRRRLVSLSLGVESRPLLTGTVSASAALVLELVTAIDEGRGRVAAFPASAVAGDQLNDHIRILAQHVTGYRR